MKGRQKDLSSKTKIKCNVLIKERSTTGDALMRKCKYGVFAGKPFSTKDSSYTCSRAAVQNSSPWWFRLISKTGCEVTGR